MTKNNAFTRYHQSSPATAEQENGKTKGGKEQKTAGNSDVEPGAGKVGGAEGEDGGDERHRRHPDWVGRSQVTDILLPQAGEPAGDVRECDRDAVVAVTTQPGACVADHRLFLLHQHHRHGVFKDQGGPAAVGTTLFPGVGREEGEVCRVVRVNRARGEGEMEGSDHLIHLSI